VKVFQTKSDTSGRDIQSTPVEIVLDVGGKPEKLKVDIAYKIDSFVIVAGWRTGDLGLQLCTPTSTLHHRTIQVPRPDVISHLDLTVGDDLGFVLMSEHNGQEPIMLAWQARNGERCVSAPLRFEIDPEIDRAASGPLGPALGLLALGMPVNSPKWTNLVSKAPTTNAPCRTAVGVLESSAVCELTNTAIVVGWEAHARQSTPWLEDDKGNVFALDGAYRRFRSDVDDAIRGKIAAANLDTGFIIRLQGLKPGCTLRLKAISDSGVHVLSETQCISMPSDPAGAARHLFSLHTPQSEFVRRLPIVDEPLLNNLIKHKADSLDELAVTTKQLGAPVNDPSATVIVPIFGRMDFVEHQLIEFCEDPWFVKNCELIYVLDDPSLVERFIVEAENLYRLYRLSFRWVWGSANRGFSGANNLGVEHARGKHLVFLNSDAFPREPGWVQALLQVLADRPEIGAVGPRLVFADGSIQHAGIEFVRRDELGIWVNHHPNMGLDPAHDPHKELAVVPCVTGACLAMRRADFDAVGGWDTGYLIGDFEDSDLCLKLQSKGFKIGYLPTIELTHLERQSFKLLGQDEFRMRVVIYNAVRHQTRWASLIQGAAQPESAP
jgi:GT2 family glycosyltransferase